jgi:hypothetical protein
MASGITGKHWRYVIKENQLLMCSDMTVEEAVEFFQNVPYIYRKIKVLEEVGTGLYHTRPVGSYTKRWRSTAGETFY